MNQALLAGDIAAVMPAAIDTGLFPSLCTFRSPSGVLTDSGAPDGLYVDIAGLVAIPCTAPPVSTARLQASEIRSMAEILATEPHHVLLAGYYPAARAAWLGGAQAVIDGLAYTVMGVEHDSQKTMTRVSVRTGSI